MFHPSTDVPTQKVGPENSTLGLSVFVVYPLCICHMFRGIFPGFLLMRLEIFLGLSGPVPSTKKKLIAGRAGKLPGVPRPEAALADERVGGWVGGRVSRRDQAVLSSLFSPHRVRVCHTPHAR